MTYINSVQIMIGNIQKAVVFNTRRVSVIGITALVVAFTGQAGAHFVDLDGEVEVEGGAYVTTGDGFAVRSSSGCVATSDRSDDNQIAACEGLEEPEEEVVEEPAAEPEPVEVEEPVVQEQVTETLNLSGAALFATNSSELTGDGEAALVDLVGKLQAMQEISSLAIMGHTDDRGSIEYNQQLSEQRAQTVADYISAQIPGAPVSDVSGVGELDPIASNQTAEGRQQNRRVEVVVTGVTVK